MNEVVMNPCPADLKAAGARFDEENKVLEEALGELVRQFPSNTELAHVFLKVTALNALYGTQIPIYSRSIPDILDVAKHIVGLTIDSDLERGSDELVGKMAWLELIDKAHRYNYSFATKYCSWHKPESYPIFDSRVNECLWHLRNHHCLSRFDRQKLWEYPVLKKIVVELRDKFGLGNFTFKQIDKFLYYQGGILFDQKYKSSTDDGIREAVFPADPKESTEEYLLAQGYTPEQVATIKKKHTDWAGSVVGSPAPEDQK
jgi:hypothetical protein